MTTGVSGRLRPGFAMNFINVVVMLNARESIIPWNRKSSSMNNN